MGARPFLMAFAAEVLGMAGATALALGDRHPPMDALVKA